MNFIDGVFFFYSFVGLYMLSLFLFIYFPNRNKLFYHPPGTPEPVSIVMPCYNEADSIGDAIESLLRLDYPKKMLEIIVVDDRSSDNSVEIIQKYVKKYPNVRLIVNKKNSGGAAGPTNIGIRAAKYGYIAVADADSTPDRDALIKMIGFLQDDKKVGGVTCAVIAKNAHSFIQKLQEIEYFVIGFNRKMLDFVDSVYVTPGPFALYRKKTLFEVGLFDENNMTQDIEIVWRLISRGYVARMCLATRVHTNTPSKFRQWWKQRVRWNIGGAQSIVKHRSKILRKNMLGYFIIPFFSFSLLLGCVGFGLFLYLLIRRLSIYFLSTYYSLYANTAIVTFQDLSFSPSVLNFFGITMFFMGLLFTLFILKVVSRYSLGKRNVFNILFYHILYLSIYPLILVNAVYKLIRGKYTW